VVLAIVISSVAIAPAPAMATDHVTGGYWIVDRAGNIYEFGDASPFVSVGGNVVDTAADNRGALWVLTDDGVVHALGGAAHFGNATVGLFDPGETVSALSITPAADGYWVFTSKGRAISFGAAEGFGDLLAFDLDGPVIDSVSMPDGLGYYMVGSDGGVFAFGSAKFYGSMGGIALDQPVNGLIPDPDGVGYWLTAGDGGIFAFQAGFRGSLGGIKLNAPVIGGIAFGTGYAMVAADGGAFVFSDRLFLGSLGGDPPPDPVVSIATYDIAAVTSALISANVSATTASGPSSNPSISDDGRYVAFESAAADLVEGDANSSTDVFVRDTETNTTVRASLGSAEGEANGPSSAGAISGNGRFVVFQSDATNLSPNDGNASTDVFVRDLIAGTTTRVSVSSTESEATGASTIPSIDDSGQFVVFRSSAPDLVPSDTNGFDDVFVRDLAAGTTQIVSIATDGGQGASASVGPQISGNGQFVVFHSRAVELVTDDTNASRDVFVRDLVAETTERVSVASGGAQANGESFAGSISDDGRLVVLFSSAPDLVANDTNLFDDVFLRDRSSGTTVRVSLTETGAQIAFGGSFAPRVAGAGRFVTYRSNGLGIVAGNDNALSDVYRYDIETNITIQLSVNVSGDQVMGGESFAPAITDDGTRVAFHSDAVDVVDSDANSSTDVFVASTS